ncbi:MAG: hypothetical protein Q8R90_03775 [Bacteroidales bacterium]|nr:hypothetical protein [Bacteroidales bacterium]
MAFVIYKIGNTDISSLKIYVTNGSGYIDFPKRKIPYRHEWLDEDGEEVELGDYKAEAREIKLECIVLGTTINDAYTKINSLISLIDQSSFVRLEIIYDYPAVGQTGPTSKFQFDVFREEPVKVVKKLRKTGNAWTFTLILKDACTGIANHVTTGGASS